jgi:hypothetical protein
MERSSDSDGKEARMKVFSEIPDGKGTVQRPRPEWRNDIEMRNWRVRTGLI